MDKKSPMTEKEEVKEKLNELVTYLEKGDESDIIGFDYEMTELKRIYNASYNRTIFQVKAKWQIILFFLSFVCNLKYKKIKILNHKSHIDTGKNIPPIDFPSNGSLCRYIDSYCKKIDLEPFESDEEIIAYYHQDWESGQLKNIYIAIGHTTKNLKGKINFSKL